VSFQIIWRLFCHTIWCGVCQTCSGLYLAAKLSRGADEAAVSRQGKPVFSARTPPGFGIARPDRSGCRLLWFLCRFVEIKPIFGGQYPAERQRRTGTDAPGVEEVTGSKREPGFVRSDIDKRSVRAGNSSSTAAYGSGLIDPSIPRLKRRPTSLTSLIWTTFRNPHSPQPSTSSSKAHPDHRRSA
jgi:hypothetical protein